MGEWVAGETAPTTADVVIAQTSGPVTLGQPPTEQWCCLHCFEAHHIEVASESEIWGNHTPETLACQAGTPKRWFSTMVASNSNDPLWMVALPSVVQPFVLEMEVWSVAAGSFVRALPVALGQLQPSEKILQPGHWKPADTSMGSRCASALIQQASRG